MKFALKTSLAAIALIAATPALADAPPPDGTYFGGCTTAFTNPDALECTGYYSGNLLNGSAEDRAFQDQFLALLTGGADAFDGSLTAWNDLLKIESGSADPIDFGMTLYGLQIIGAHFGNAFETDENNVTVFWLIDFGEEGGTLTLANSQGWSNAVLYTPPGGVPEPATWAMMLMGFGTIGVALRRRRRGLVPQVA
jgi:hypothetical protein